MKTKINIKWSDSEPDPEQIQVLDLNLNLYNKPLHTQILQFLLENRIDKDAFVSFEDASDRATCDLIYGAFINALLIKNTFEEHSYLWVENGIVNSMNQIAQGEAIGGRVTNSPTSEIAIIGNGPSKFQNIDSEIVIACLHAIETDFLLRPDIVAHCDPNYPPFSKDYNFENLKNAPRYVGTLTSSSKAFEKIIQKARSCHFYFNRSNFVEEILTRGMPDMLIMPDPKGTVATMMIHIAAQYKPAVIKLYGIDLCDIIDGEIVHNQLFEQYRLYIAEAVKMYPEIHFVRYSFDDREISGVKNMRIKND